MAYWIFKCNPEKYKLEERLADPNSTITWLVSRYRDEIVPGDTAFLWITGQQRIRAVMRVESAPAQMFELESEQSYWEERDELELCRVLGTLTHRDVNLRKELLRQTPGLENLSMFHGFQQGTNFKVTGPEGEIIMGMITS